MLNVREIWRYPVKSLGGEQLESAHIGPNGIVGDRSFGIEDAVTGLILTARREPRLLMASARTSDDGPIITTADGSTLTTSQELSDWIGRAVHLVPAGEEAGTFENPMDAVNETEWVSWQGPAGSFHDSERTMVSLVSTTTLEGYEAPRFRINVILDGAGEDELVGEEIRIGGAMLEATKRIERCVMVTRAQPDLAKDLSVLKRVIHERENKLGIGAIVTKSGAFEVGDAVADRRSSAKATAMARGSMQRVSTRRF
jgi:uncharacterized protein YcbX